MNPKVMNRKVKTVSAACLAAALLLTGGYAIGHAPLQPAPVLASEAGAANPAAKHIRVTGQGTHLLKPDTVTVRLGVETEDASAKKASEANAEKMQALVEGLKKAGLKETDLETAGYAIYSTDPNGTGKTVFRVSNSLQIKSGDVAGAGKLIDTAVEAGANQVHFVEFSVQDRQAAYEKASAAALEDAKRKAEFLAKSAGIQSGLKILSISQQDDAGGYRNYGYDEMAAAKAADTGFMPGDVQIGASVSVVFSYD